MEKISRPTRIFCLTDLKLLNCVLRTLWVFVFLGLMTTFMLWHEVIFKSELVYRLRRGIPPPDRDDSLFKQVRNSVQSLIKKPSFIYRNSIQVKTVCPSEFELLQQSRNISADLTETTMTSVEELLFKERFVELNRIVHKQNLKLNVNLINRAHNRVLTKSIEEFLSPSIFLVNDYLYIPGGHWEPVDCLPRWKVALIIPFRDRHTHLPIFLKYIIPMLQKQKLEFGIFVVEQDNMLLFNRAMLLNVGFLESLNFTKWDCFIYHDVDHIPYNDGNYYGCIGMPRHFVSGVDKWGYQLIYRAFFGAVTGMTRGQMYEMNGFPNVYWGWGGEDDDIWKRVQRIGYYRTRPRSYTGWYDVIKKHHKSAPRMKDRVANLNHWKRRQFIDGLNNIVYDEPIITLHPLYTNIAVDIKKITLDVHYNDTE